MLGLTDVGLLVGAAVGLLVGDGVQLSEKKEKERISEIEWGERFMMHNLSRSSESRYPIIYNKKGDIACGA